MKALVLLLFSSACLFSQETKPNVLFIAIDDLRNFVNCFGYQQAITPNMDRLAKRSTIFTNAHNQAPMCGPSRTSCMTGILPSSSGAYGFVDWRKVPYLDNCTSLNKHFVNNSYAALSGGKIYHGQHNKAGEWTKIYSQALAREGTWGVKEMKHVDRAVKTYWPGKKKCGPSDVPEDKFHDTIMATKAVKQLARDFDKPWFIAVGFTKPHLPWIAPRKYFDMYNAAALKMPIVLKNDISDTPPAAQFPSYQVHALAIDREKGAARRLLHAYLATITYMDAQLGRVLDAFDKRKDADNTVIVLWSDHGWHLGEKQCWSKFTLWRESTRNPLMISLPGQKTAKVCKKPVQLLDIYPTLVDVCALSRPANELDGHSLLPLLLDPQTTWEWPAITCNGRDSYSLTFERWKYNRFFDGSEELYDHQNDPHELKNLAADSANKKLISSFKKYLPTKSHPNISDGNEWMLWLEDYPNLQEWSKEMEEIKAHLKRTGKIKNIFRKKCRAAVKAAQVQ